MSQSEGQDPSAEVGLVERQSPFILRRLCRARVARSECDIRNLALKKLKSILLLDLEATSLGRSLTTTAKACLRQACLRGCTVALPKLGPARWPRRRSWVDLSRTHSGARPRLPCRSGRQP